MKIVEEMPGTVSMVDQEKEPLKSKGATTADLRECRNCGRRHEFSRHEVCPAFGKTCNRYQKPNHFAIKCRTRPSRSVRVIEEGDTAEEVFHLGLVWMTRSVLHYNWITAITCDSK